MKRVMIAALFLAITTPAADPDVEAVKEAAAAFAPHMNESGTWIRGEGADRLLAAQWHAVQAWAAHWLDRHPGAAPAQLERAAQALGKDAWSISAASLGHGDMLVAAANGPATVFILGRAGSGGYRLRWSIAAPQARLNPIADRRLSWWSPTGLWKNCPAPAGCAMPTAATTLRLPDAADGAARFAISSAYAREAGSTGRMQLSIWSWKNGRARPIAFHDYSAMIEQQAPVLRGATLHVPARGNWHSLNACGSCFGPEIDLPFVIGPHAVRMLPPVSLTPEADLIDRVFTRVIKQQPIGTLASPAAVRVIQRQLTGPLHETDPQLRGFLGMYGGWHRWRANGRHWACVNTEEGGTTAFAFNAGLTRITQARILKPESCQGEGAHKQ